MSSGTLFLLGLLLFVGLILAVTILARGFRSKLIWTPLGRTLVSIGFTNANGTIDDLKPGQRYVVTQSFADLQPGQTLTYRGQQYIDHVGHIVEFDERTVNLHDEKDAAVLRKLWAYLEPLNS